MVNKPTVMEVKTVTEICEKEIHEIGDTLIPLLKVYLDELRKIRMAFASEIVLIMQSVRNTNEITKATEELKRFTNTVDQLSKLLTPEFVNTISKLTK